MLKGGMLSAPVIQPLRCNQSVGTRLKVCPNTYIQIKTDIPGSLIFFTTDGTKPDPFQKGRTGRCSTNKYVGPFRLQLGKRVVRAIVTSRDRLRESPVSTKYIDVTIEPPSPDENSSFSDPEELAPVVHEVIEEFPGPIPFIRRSNSELGFHRVIHPVPMMPPPPPPQTDYEGHIEGPINPVNYHGTQINVWGIPPPNLGGFLDPRRQIQQPQPPVQSKPEEPPKNELSSLPESLRKFFKQVQRLYERDSDFQSGLDALIENGQVKEVDITEKWDSFNILIKCPKFKPDEPPKVPKLPPGRPKPRPTPPPRTPSPEIVIAAPPPPKKEPVQKPVSKPVPKPAPKPEPAPEPKKPEVKKEPAKPLKNDPKLPSTYLEELEQNGTVVPAPNFNADDDAEKLHNAMKGMGTNEKVLIEIVGNRSNEQRLKYKDMFKAMFGKDLVEEIKSETSGNFKKLLVSCLMNPIEFDCMEISKAIKGLGTDNSALIELFTSRSNKRIQDISALYSKLYKKKMEDEVQSDTSGSFKKLLTSLMTGNRSEANEVDLVLVRSDVDELIAAGIKKWGTDESKFNQIFAARSYAHLRQVFLEYDKKAGKTIEDSIKNEMSGNVAKTYLALVNCVRSRPIYFAKEVKKAIKGLGTDEHTLNRIVVSRSEIDTVQIKEEYQKLYKNALEDDVRRDVSGDYGELLALLLRDPAKRVYENGGPEEEHVIVEVEEPKAEETPTLVKCAGFNADSDCDKLRKAMKGLGTDEKELTRILGRRDSEQRQEILKVYKTRLGRDLVKDLESENSGSYLEALRALMMTPLEYDVVSYRNAIKGLGTDESTLIELLTTRSTAQITEAKNAYAAKYNRDLEKDIKSDTSGDFKQILVSLLTAMRPAGNKVDMTQAKKDAQKLVDAGVNKTGTDETKFITVLCTRSYAQLRQIFKDYQEVSGHSIEEGCKKEMSGDLLRVFEAIIGCVRDKQAYYASLVHKAIKGLGTKENMLIRTIVSRCEVDMVQIKQKFRENYEATMSDWVKGDTSGDFRALLLTLIDEYEEKEDKGSDKKSSKEKEKEVEEEPEIPMEQHVFEEREEPKVEEKPTLVEFSGFNAGADCDKLRKAMKGLGTDEKAIVEVLGYRTNKQRQEILKTYKTSLGRDLLKDLNSELSGNFKDTIESLMMTSVDYDAASFRQAMKGLGTNVFNRELEKDIISDTSGDFKSVLVSLLQANRPTGNKVDVTQAKVDAKKLMAGGIKKKGTDESVFVTILCSKSYAQLRATFSEYESLAGMPIEETIKKEFSGDLKESFLAIVQCVKDKQAYFAELLNKSMKGAGTKDGLLIRVIVSRCEIDMVQIKEKFASAYNATLASFIKGDTSGDYKRILMALIGEDSK